MRIVVFGSTGSIGRQLVEQALEQGHVVTAFARNPARISIAHANLKVAPGDVMDYQSVERTVQGQEAALCSIGAGRKGVVRTEGTRHIVRALESAGVRRFICQSTLGIGDSRAALNFFWKYIMFGMLLREAYADHQQQEEIVTRSRLDWTIVRPAAFTDGPRTGAYRHGFPAAQKELMLKISRADVADFMLKQLTDTTYVRETPALSY